MTIKRQYDRSDVEWLVGQYHVSTPMSTITCDVERRTKTWSHTQRMLAMKDAVSAHKANRAVYYNVMRRSM